MMKFYRQETSRILAFLQFLSTTCVTLVCSDAILFNIKELTDVADSEMACLARVLGVVGCGKSEDG
jgi:hypothetical protein